MEKLIAISEKVIPRKPPVKIKKTPVPVIKKTLASSKKEKPVSNLTTESCEREKEKIKSNFFESESDDEKDKPSCSYQGALRGIAKKKMSSIF